MMQLCQQRATDMLPRLFICMMCAVFAGAGCSIIGGGIAGAGWDSVWARRSAENYVGFSSPRVEIKTEASTIHSGLTWSEFNSLLSSPFPQHGTVSPNQSARLANWEILLRPAHVQITFPDGAKLDEPLPSVFRARPFQFAACTLGGEPILILLNRARATTGLCFLGLYTRDGNRLLTRVFPRQAFWMVHTMQDALVIESDKQRITIRMSKK